MKKLSIWIIITQLLVPAACLIVYKKIALLPYINTSFAIGALLILVSLLGLVIKGRFFDIAFRGFQNFFGKMEDLDRAPLSGLMPQSYRYPLATGFILLLVMFILLLFHYDFL